MSDDEREEAERRWPNPVEYQGWVTPREMAAQRLGFEQCAEWQASRKVEAAPSDTDLDTLTLIARDVHLYDGGPNQALAGLSARRIAEAAIAAGFSRSQPVQVEVTDETGRLRSAIAEALELTQPGFGMTFPVVDRLRAVLAAALTPPVTATPERPET